MQGNCKPTVRIYYFHSGYLIPNYKEAAIQMQMRRVIHAFQCQTGPAPPGLTAG
jgi:hypothetical protein